MYGTESRLPEPQWVMLGFTTPEGVGIIASRTLTIGELKVIYKDEEEWWPGVRARRIHREPDITLSCKMRDGIVVYADTYKEALARLMESWALEPTNQIGPGW